MFSVLYVTLYYTQLAKITSSKTNYTYQAAEGGNKASSIQSQQSSLDKVARFVPNRGYSFSMPSAENCVTRGKTFLILQLISLLVFARPTPSGISPMAIENGLVQLRAISTSLHLLYHRNKNQHRQSKWWKWLTMLRRNVIKLSQELQKSQRDQCTARINYFKNVLLPRCYG